ncbi:MAG: hypothetical protein SPL96_00360 [Bacteroidales bacterium]|nr:hypothetical protein [Bacteroidales bacterium]
MKKIAFIDGNRAINKNNVKKHVESFKKFGKNLVPLLYVEATDVVGHTLYDADSGDVVAPESYSEYWVVLDGQHRYKAAKQLADSDDANGFTMNNLVWQKVELGDNSFEDVLIEVNSRTQPWKGADYICGCVLHNPEDEALQFAHTLVGQGVSGKTVAKYLFGKVKFKWADAVVNVDAMTGANVQRAREIWAVVKKFPQKMQKTSIIIDHLNAVGKYWNVELDKIDALTNDQKESFNSSKVKELRSKFTDLMSA